MLRQRRKASDVQVWTGVPEKCFFALRAGDSLPRLRQQCDAGNTSTGMRRRRLMLRSRSARTSGTPQHGVRRVKGQLNAHGDSDGPARRRPSRGTHSLGDPGTVPRSGSRPVVRSRRSTAQGGSHLPALPGDAAVRCRCTGQSRRVRCVGRHDRTPATRSAQAAPRSRVLGRLLRSAASAPERRIGGRAPGTVDRSTTGRPAGHPSRVSWSPTARSASRSETSNGSDGTPTSGTRGCAAVNLPSRCSSRFAVTARWAWIRSTASAG